MTNAGVPEQSTPSEKPRGFRFGLRWGLNGAFAGVASLTIAASFVAFLSYTHIGESLKRVDDDAVPALTSALGVARESEELSAISARVLAAESEQQLSTATAKLESERRVIRPSLDALASTSVGAAAATELSNGVIAVLDSTRDIAASVRERLGAGRLRNTLVKGATEAHRAVIEKIGPMLEDAKSNLMKGFEGLSEQPSREAILNAAARLKAGAAPRVETLGDLLAEANEVLAILTQIAGTTDNDLFVPMNERFAVARDRIRNLAGKLDQSPASEDLRRAFDAFLGFGDAETGILAARRHELISMAQDASLMAANYEKAARLGDAVNKTVGLARATSVNAVAASRRSIRDSGGVLLSLMIFNLLAAATIAYLFVERVVVAPLSRLKDAALAVASGDFDAKVPHPGRSEIGRMATAIEIFKQNSIRAREFDAERAKQQAAEVQRREKIETYVAAFDTTGRELSEALAAASIEMDTTARAMSDTAQEAGQEVTNVDAAATKATDCVRRAAEAAEEMSQSIREICEKIGVSSRIALRATDEAKRADSTMRGMAQVAARIGEVVGLIRQVANQTNLLALNATIEAARAGEAGRGFAVVAGEVKELAMQTEKATQDVAAQVKAIQATAEDAVQVIRTIGVTIENMNEIGSAIAAAMTQQSVATSEIARAVQTAADSTNQVNQSIRTVDRGVAGTGMAACRVLTAAADLGQRAEALQGEIGQFLKQIRAA